LAKVAAEKRRVADPVRFQALRQAKTLRERTKKAELPLLWNSIYAEYALDWWKRECAYCGASLSDGLWHRLNWDHFIAGTDHTYPGTVPWNLLPVCGSSPNKGTGRDLPLCNCSKINRKPEEWLLRMILDKRQYLTGRALTPSEQRACKGLATRRLKKIRQFFQAAAGFAKERGDIPAVPF
jgi:hypothetical protein